MIETLRRARHWVQSPVRAVLLLGAIAVGMVLIATEIYLLDLKQHELRHQQQRDRRRRHPG